MSAQHFAARIDCNPISLPFLSITASKLAPSFSQRTMFAPFAAGLSSLLHRGGDLRTVDGLLLLFFPRVPEPLR